MHIIGRNIDKAYRIQLIPPGHVSGTSEFCRKNDLYKIQLTAPNDDNAASKTFKITLYASNSQSIPYVNQETNYWKTLIPTWRFYDTNKKIIYSINVTTDKPCVFKDGETIVTKGLYGEAEFHYVDDMPSKKDSPIYIWATLDLDDFSVDRETIKVGQDIYTPPVYANSKLIAVAPVVINPVIPSKISITRNGKDLLSTGIYWSDQTIPFIATINSDHYDFFREKDNELDPPVELASDIVYNCPFSIDDEIKLKGNIGIKYNADEVISFDSLIDKYLYFVKNKWDFLSTYLPPENVLETSSYIPQPIETKTETIENILEVMDWPTYNDLQIDYPDIDLGKYFHTINEPKNDYYEYYGSSGADLRYLSVDNYKKLISEHKIFKYIPYALRIVDTISLDETGVQTTTWCNFSAYDKLSEELTFKLIDKTNGYNYKTGGYALGVTTCPSLSGENRTGTIFASADFGESSVEKDIDFHLIKYVVISDGGAAYIAHDTNSNYPQMQKDICGFLNKNQLLDQVNVSGSVVESDQSTWLTDPQGSYGISCVTQDPLYNIWASDPDTGHMYKLDGGGKKIHDIDLTKSITKYLNSAKRYQTENNITEIDADDPLATQIITDNMLKYWNEVLNSTKPGSEGKISPTNIVLDSQNNLYVTSYDQMVLVKMSGFNGEILGVWPFPDSIFKDHYSYSNKYDELEDKDKFELNSGWKVVGVDTNEFDEVAVLFQTKISESEDEPIYGLTNSVKVALFNGYDFTGDTFDLSDKSSASLSTIKNDSLIDTSQILYRSTNDKDFIFVAGTIAATVNGKHKETAYVWRYEMDRNDHENKSVFTVFKKYTMRDVPLSHYGIDSMFMDQDKNLWFIYNKDNFEINSTYDSKIYKCDNAMDDIIEKAHEISEITGNFSAISQASNDDMLLLSNGTSNVHSGAIKRYRFNPETEQYFDLNADILVDKNPINGGGELFACGDWTGSDFLNKYTKKIPIVLTTIDVGNQFTLHSYEKYYIRKHNEEWDVAEHMKIPVSHTSFVEDNPTLFESIGITLGTDEHKTYSVGKKLFEGIANQVQNIHDIDECHIDSIYNIAQKENVNIDKFILSYPEELRRIVDIMSIDKKKLWGERCDCTQNYFKTKHKDATKYCPKCNHVHRSNLDDIIDPFDDNIWNLTKYREKYNNNLFVEWDETELTTVLSEQLLVFSTVFNVSPEITCDSTSILDFVDPVNELLTFAEDAFSMKLTKIPNKHTSQIDKILNQLFKISLWLHELFISMSNSYIAEDKFNRNTFLKINMSVASYNEAKNILQKIKNDEFLSDDDRELLKNKETNDRIILQISILDIEEQAYDMIQSGEDEEIVKAKIQNSQILAIHSYFFLPDKWFNFCFWKFNPIPCHTLNTSVINWNSKYNTLPENNDEIKDAWYRDPYEESTIGETGTMEKILNYILHNGFLFNKDNKYIDD